jgi:hypothetical protein
MSDPQFLQLITILTTLAGFGVAEYRATRARRWAKQDAAERAAVAAADRAATRDEIIATAKAEAEATRIRSEAAAETLRLQTALHASRLLEEQNRVADELRAHAQATTEDLKTEIIAARADAAEAYKEANGVNLKLETMSRAAIAAASGRRTTAIVPVVEHPAPADDKPRDGGA